MGKKFDLSAMIDTVSGLGPAAVETRDIETITGEILRLKQDAGNAILAIGDRLLEAKAMLSHGEWLPWLTEQVEFSESTAQRFMRLAREWRNPSALTDLGATKALTLLALPPEERESFMTELHCVNGEEKTVIDMTSRELEQAIRERDEARQAAAAAEADAKSAEASRAKMEADIKILKSELKELKARPVDVAVMAVDQEKLDKAEEARKAAEAALADANARLEAAAKAEKKAVVGSDRDLAAFELLFGQAQEIANKLHGLLLKARGREDASQAAGMQKALRALADSIGKAAEV